MVDSSMLGGLQPIALPKARHDRPQRDWWEATRLCAIRALLEPGDVLIDVGAEAGDQSALFAMWGAQVVCVEPNWLAWPSIRICFEANDVQPLACFDGFASCSDGVWNLHLDGWPTATLEPYTAATDFRTLHEYPELPRSTVDTLAEHLAVSVDVVTVDVEGAEGRVLAGMERVLAEDRPYVFLSLHPDEWLSVYGDSEATVRRRVQEAGYEWVPLTDEVHERHVLLCPLERFWGW